MAASFDLVSDLPTGADRLTVDSDRARRLLVLHPATRAAAFGA